MKLVFDATPLIYLGKKRLLEKIRNIQSTNIIPTTVYKEVVEKGKEIGEDDAIYIEKLVRENIFVIKDVENVRTELIEHIGLHKADKEVLTLAKEMKAIALIDEEIGRNVAEIEGIKARGTIFLIFLLLKEKQINKKQARENIDKMLEHGWRCSTELYAFILEELKKIKKLEGFAFFHCFC